ncbi:hypothetical protein BD289DRAFT_79773 [Coniella lustricola]|uniref:Uncharacterized protein n=1 Tax=Coniella lustricola TaxID=2025994 RepID=A0A2T2ZZ76_9PEZI|nr:hypothetical protein BD289DRAFT_79773 [Coniella lustricola]
MYKVPSLLLFACRSFFAVGVFFARRSLARLAGSSAFGMAVPHVSPICSLLTLLPEEYVSLRVAVAITLGVLPGNRASLVCGTSRICPCTRHTPREPFICLRSDQATEPCFCNNRYSWLEIAKASLGPGARPGSVTTTEPTAPILGPALWKGSGRRRIVCFGVSDWTKSTAPIRAPVVSSVQQKVELQVYFLSRHLSNFQLKVFKATFGNLYDGSVCSDVVF